MTYFKAINGSYKKELYISQALTCPEYIIAKLICSNVTVKALLTVVEMRKKLVVPPVTIMPTESWPCSAQPQLAVQTACKRVMLFIYDYLSTLQ